MKEFMITVFSVLLPVFAIAQTMDDASIKKLEGGEYSLESGKIQVTFVDTVSVEFIDKEMEIRGYEIISSNFQNLILSIENNPEPGQLNEIEGIEWVDFIMTESASMKDEDVEEISRKDTVDSDKVNKVLTLLNQTGDYEFIIVGMTYNATQEHLEKLREMYPGLEIKVSEKSQRTAILKTETDKELEAMDELEKLSFVKNTAFIGNLEQ
jgi:hypothetical protein